MCPFGKTKVEGGVCMRWVGGTHSCQGAGSGELSGEMKKYRL